MKQLPNHHLEIRTTCFA